VTQLDIFGSSNAQGVASGLRTFTFAETGEEFQAVVIDGSAWLVAAPIARALSYRDAADMVRSLDADQKGTHTVRTPGGEQRLYVISEPGLWRVITNRRKGAVKDARLRERIERFQRWVFHEVIPAAVRGDDPNKPRREIPRSFADALQLAADQARQIEQQQAAIAELEPKAEQADHFRKADGLHAVGDFANDLALWARETHGVKILHSEVRDFLGELKLLIRGETVRNNEPQADAIKRGLMRPKHTTFDTKTRGPQTKGSARFTPKGWGYAWDRAVKRIAAHGSLKPSTDIDTREG
jgi:anti-repressor protein